MCARFYIRRILRIWPLYFAFLFGAAIRGNLVAQFHITPKYLILLVLMSGNIADALWGWTPTFIVSQLWSISLEEQFYLLWPLVVRGGRRRTPRHSPRSSMIAVSIVARTICWLVQRARIVRVDQHADAPRSSRGRNPARRVGDASAFQSARDDERDTPGGRPRDDADRIGMLRSILESRIRR